MKKIFLLLIAFFMLFGLYSCEDVNPSTDNPSTEIADKTNDYFIQTSLDDVKMTALAKDAEALKDIEFVSDGLRYIYFAEVNVGADKALSVIRKNDTRQVDYVDMGITKETLGEEVSFEDGFKTQYAGKYNIFFFIYSGKVVMKAELVEKGDDPVVVEPTLEELLAKVHVSNTSYTYDGKEHQITISIDFEGYRVDANGKVSYTEAGTYEVKYNIVKVSDESVVASLTETLTIVSPDVETYTVKFGANGGSGEMADQANIVGDYRLPNCQFVGENGQVFAGWDLNGTVYQAGATIQVSANITLNATWKMDYSAYEGEDVVPTKSTNLQENVQDGLILHAFLWSYNDIKNNMKMIADAGYTAVQTSPVQQPKDYHEAYPTGWAEQWSKVYQPLSFSFATSGWLGTKAEFSEMCAEAHKYGVKVIVDIVANHMANNVLTEADESNNSKKAQLYSGHKDTAINATLPGIQQFEPTLYNNQKTYVRSYIAPGDGSAQAVTQGNNGWPDLNTGNSYVQERVISLLSECIEAGADGFRFDAAKHIETPDDGAVASNFWPNILTAATNKAGSKKLYYYGEILNTPGQGRSYDSYTKYMSVTDNKVGNGILSSVVNHNASGAANSNYNIGAANKAVLWAESHDTYGDGSTVSISTSDVNKAWAMVASRNGATALYFSRPTNMGQIGKTDFASKEVAAVNLFHNLFVGASEYVGSSGNFAYVERYTSSKAGIVIINVNGNAASINLSVNNLPDGKYYDQISGNEFSVSNKKLTGNMGNTGIVVLTNVKADLTPEVNLSKKGGVFSKSIEVDVTLEGEATSTAMYVNGEVKQILTKSGKVTITAPQDGMEIDVKFVTVNQNKGYKHTQSYKFIRLDAAKAGAVIITDIPETYLNTSKYKLWAWVWPDGGDGRAIAGEIVGSYLVVNGKKSSENNILIVLTSSSATNFAWNYASMKTSDVALSEDNIASCPKSVWQKP